MPITAFGSNTGNSGTGEDATNWAGDPGANDNGPEILVRNNSGGSNERHGFVRFTGLTALAGGTINSATIRFTVSQEAFGEVLTFFETLRAWTETGVTWATYDGANSWTTAGGTGSGDSSASPSASGTWLGVPGTDVDFTLNATGIAALAAAIASDGVLDFLITSNTDTNQRIISNSGADGDRPRLIVDYTTGGSSTTVTPGRGEVIVFGNQLSVNPFSNVRIREVMINEAGSPLANMANMKLVIWYGGVPSGAPDLSYSAVTTDANGTMSYSIATGSLAYNQAIFYALTDGSSSLSAWTCARMVPTYT